MALIKAHKFPATWLLQYDSLVMGPYVAFLKSNMPPGHETGLWLEVDHKLCDDARITFQGPRALVWDKHVPVDFGIGYKPDERRRLADVAMATFRRTFGHDAKVIGSWMIDAVTAAHLSDTYGIEAFGNCRDQLSTDGFTIWGAPITAYYPSRNNAYSPSLSSQNQIGTPMFRLLGQEPVYYYDNQIPYPDTMEPVWPSGQSPSLVNNFLHMIAKSPSLSVAHAQLGQENSMGWPNMHKAYPMQMEALALERSNGLVVETMSETGRRFKQRFSSTPTQAQIMLKDPYGHKENPQRTVWYQSKFYRGNLHFRGNNFYLRDLQVYSDSYPQLYLNEPTHEDYVEHRMLAALDGYHWSDPSVLGGGAGTRASGEFILLYPDGRIEALTMRGIPAVQEHGTLLETRVPLSGGGDFLAEFSERDIAFSLKDTPKSGKLGLLFEWIAEKSALQKLSADRLHYRFRNYDYSVRLLNGIASGTSNGVRILALQNGPLRLEMAQQ